MWSGTMKPWMLTLFTLLLVALSQGKRLPAALYELEVLGDPGAEEYRFVRKDITEEATKNESQKPEDSSLEQEKKDADQDLKNDVGGAVIQEESLKAEDAFQEQEKRGEDKALGSCSWAESRFGSSLKCPKYTVATGQCVGGQDSKCNSNAWSRLKCCKVEPNEDAFDCETKKNRYFKTENCPEWKPFVTQLCDVDSGSCGQEFMDIAYKCCKLSKYRVHEDKCEMKFTLSGMKRSCKKNCQWKYEAFGKSISCGDNEVVTGRCGLRGRHPDGCGDGSQHGIRCCRIRKL